MAKNGIQENTPDRWVKCIATAGNIRGVAIQANHLVQEIVDLHGLEGLAARSLGEALIGSLLHASYCKSGERINLNIRGSGLIKQALVDAYPDGKVRGYVIERTDEKRQTTREDGSDLGPWGTGMLSVLRTKQEDSNRPYIGTVPLLTGHLAKDLTFYWAQSEQTPSAVGLAVLQEGKDGKKITSAGGFLVQALPGASAEEVRTIENHIQEISALASELGKDGDPLHLLSKIFQSTAFMIVEEKPLKFECQCTWERVERALTLVGSEELSAILKDEGKADVKCDFCSKKYEIDGDRLKRLIDRSTGVSRA